MFKFSLSLRNNPRYFWKEVYLNIFTICLKWNLNNQKGQIAKGQETITKLNDKRGTLTLEKKRLEQELKDFDEQYEKIRLLLEQKGYVRKRRENVSYIIWFNVNYMISDNSSSNRYRRGTETKKILEFIHGEVEASLHGAWDYFKSNASSKLIEQLFLSFKRGKFLQKLCGKFKEKDEVSIKMAVPLKDHSFVSRRSYNFLCKIQLNNYNPENESYRKNMMSYGDY